MPTSPRWSPEKITYALVKKIDQRATYIVLQTPLRRPGNHGTRMICDSGICPHISSSSTSNSAAAPALPFPNQQLQQQQHRWRGEAPFSVAGPKEAVEVRGGREERASFFNVTSPSYPIGGLPARSPCHWSAKAITAASAAAAVVEAEAVQSHR